MYKDPLKMALEFDQGCVDRTYIQYAPDRGGEVEMDWPLARAHVYAWTQYVNVGVRGPSPWEQSRIHHMNTRIQEPYSTKPLHNKWAI